MSYISELFEIRIDHLTDFKFLLSIPSSICNWDTETVLVRADLCIPEFFNLLRLVVLNEARSYEVL